MPGSVTRDATGRARRSGLERVWQVQQFGRLTRSEQKRWLSLDGMWLIAPSSNPECKGCWDY